MYVSEVQVSAVLSDGHLIRHASPKLYADNFGILHFDGFIEVNCTCRPMKIISSVGVDRLLMNYNCYVFEGIIMMFK